MSNLSEQEMRKARVEEIKNTYPKSMLFFYGNYFIIYHSLADRKAKQGKIDRGDTKGFLKIIED